MDNSLTSGVNSDRRRFLTAATTVVGAVGAGFATVPFIKSWQPSAQTKAAGVPIDVDISKLALGSQLTIPWRGKPMLIVRRSQQVVDDLEGLSSQLRDPNSEKDQQPKYAQNTMRSIKPEILVLVGVCTHLGCVPKYLPAKGSISPNWLGGFHCPCHGSTFDFAGRVFKGVPAPTNLEVPPYRFLSESIIRIGEDADAANTANTNSTQGAA